MLVETSKFVRDQLQNTEDRVEIINIQRRLIGYDKPLNMEKTDLKFLLETPFSCNGHKRVLLLFDDCLMIGKPSRNNQIKITDKIELQVVFYEKSKKEQNTFILKSPYAVYHIYGKSEDVTTWIKAFERYLPSRKRNPTFGRPITEILTREGSKVPSIVIQCLETIESLGGIDTEGLFRISGESKELQTLKEYFDNSMLIYLFHLFYV